MASSDLSLKNVACGTDALTSLKPCFCNMTNGKYFYYDFTLIRKKSKLAEC